MLLGVLEVHYTPSPIMFLPLSIALSSASPSNPCGSKAGQLQKTANQPYNKGRTRPAPIAVSSCPARSAPCCDPCPPAWQVAAPERGVAERAPGDLHRPVRGQLRALRGRGARAAGAGALALQQRPRHGERSRLQLLLKLARTATAVFTFWLFNLAVPVHLSMF